MKILTALALIFMTIVGSASSASADQHKDNFQSQRCSSTSCK